MTAPPPGHIVAPLRHPLPAGTSLWLNVAVVPHFSWPNVLVELPFEGHRIFLSPESDELACRAAVLAPDGITFEAGGTLLSRLFSRLCWVKNRGLVEHFHGGSNNSREPGRLSLSSRRSSGWAGEDPPRFVYLPLAAEPDADLALALYREGLSVNSAPFRFLSLYKVLNIRMRTGAEQKEWINAHLDGVRYPPALDRLRLVQGAHKDVGRYLYAQGRCAVAHASEKTRVNPDDYAERKRLEDDLPLMQALAALYIEQELGVMSDSSFFRVTQGPAPGLLWRSGEVDGRVVYKEGPWPQEWLYGDSVIFTPQEGEGES